MKFIDVEKLKAEIKRLREECSSPISVCNDILSLIEFMQDQPTKGYDEKYLNEKIAKAKKSWDGVDVDKFMDDVRGREQQEQLDNEDIDKVAQELYEHLYELKRRNNVPTNLYDKQEIIELWKAGIEYGRNHTKQEQPEVDLNEEVEEYLDGFIKTPTREYFRKAIKYFYSLGLNARKED